MLIFLQYVGGFILAIIILLFIGYVYLKMKFGKFLGANTDQTPIIIHLNEDLVTPEWLEKPKATKLIANLENLGFNKGKPYRIQEMDGVSLLSFFKNSYIAVVYNHPIAGNWIDIVFETEDEHHYTASNAPMGGELSTSAKDIKTFEPNATVEEIFSLIREQTHDKQGILVNNENFKAFFENAYKREMVWKALQGGTSREEFDKIAENSKIKISDKNSEKAFTETKKQELDVWSEYGVNEFLKEKNEDDFEGSLFIVPENTHPCAFIEYLSEYGMIEEEQVGKLCQKFNSKSIGSIFEILNAALSPELKATKIGKITFPIKADVYQKKWSDY